jgi:hypothetical protein
MNPKEVIKMNEGNKMTEEDFKKIVENLPKMDTEELMKEYLKLRNGTDWSLIAPSEFHAKGVLLNEMSEEIRRRNYGKDKQTRTDSSGKGIDKNA